MQDTLLQLFARFDEKLTERVAEVEAGGGVVVGYPLKYHLVGQVALLLADLPFDITATVDIDIMHTYRSPESQWLASLCLDVGLMLESDHALIWMPPETEYVALFAGRYLHVEVAKPMYVIASKCRFQRERDRELIQAYLQQYPAAETAIAAMGVDTSWLHS